MTIVNQDPYIRSDRSFPTEVEELSDEVNKTYVDIANAVNSREIGIYAKNKPSVTGQQWYFTPQKQQTLRQVYNFTSTANLPHGINVTKIKGMTLMSGTYTDGTNWYGLISSSSAITGENSFYIDGTNIVFLAGAGAPTLTSGIIVLEWLSEI